MSDGRARAHSARSSVGSISVPAQQNGDRRSVRSDVTSQDEYKLSKRRRQRSPSKSYRRVIEAEVASGEEYIYSDDAWKVDVHTPVRLLSYTQYLDFLDPRIARKIIQSHALDSRRRARSSASASHWSSCPEARKPLTSSAEQVLHAQYASVTRSARESSRVD